MRLSLPRGERLSVEAAVGRSYARLSDQRGHCGVQTWKEDYPWLQLAFRQIGPGARAASDGWRVRIEDELKTTLDFKLRADGTATVWCGMSGYDFHHDPTPKELLEGLADAYRRELKRVGGRYPTRTATWKMSTPEPTGSEETLEPSSRVMIAMRRGPVEISRDACDLLLDEIRGRGPDDAVVRALERAGSSGPVELDRVGKIVVFDALWALAENAGGYDRIDPDLRVLQDTMKLEIAENL
jgi:hypothetical protein